MTPDSTGSPRPWLARMAALAVSAVVFSACGVAGTATTSESTSPTSLPTPEQVPAGNVPEYGASLDEFLDASVEQADGDAPPDGFAEIEWEDLIPVGSSYDEISARFDEQILEVEPGSPEADSMYAALQAEFDNQPINPDLAGTAVQLAGFVAPLTYEDELVTEFLLVPYFGACIHVPPPPPNQTIMVSLEDGQGLSIDDAWGTIWVTGTLDVDGADTDLATAGYTIDNAQAGVYTGV